MVDFQYALQSVETIDFKHKSLFEKFGVLKKKILSACIEKKDLLRSV